MERLELLEEFNKKGVCVRRTLNGHELSPDTEPSAVIFRNVTNLTQKFFLTPQEAQHRYGFAPSNRKKGKKRPC